MEWKELKNQDDIDFLLKEFSYFHDGCLKEMHMWTKHYVGENHGMACTMSLDTNVRMLFHSQSHYLPAIELYFEEVTGVHIVPSPEDYFSIITGTTFKKIEDEFYWSDYEEHDPNDFKSSNITWISAKEAKWRNASEWIGPTNRYGVNDQ